MPGERAGRALTSDDRADRRWRSGRLGDEDLARLAERLAVLHESETPAPEPERHAGPAAARRLALALCEEAGRLAGGGSPLAGPLRQVAERQRAFAEAHASWLQARIDRECIRVGPRDRRLAEVWLRDDGGVTLDPPSQVAARDGCLPAAGVALDLVWFGAPRLGERMLASYADASDDYLLYRVVDFLARELACERARAACHVAGAERREGATEGPGESALSWLELAGGIGSAAREPVRVVALGGQVASGKSTVARELAGRLGVPRVVADHVREFRMGAPAGREPTVAERLRGLEPGFDERVGRAVLDHAACVLDSGRGVVLDAGFPRARLREAARDLAQRYGAPFAFVECRADDATVARRLATRDASNDEPGHWRDIQEAYRRRWEPPGGELSGALHLVVDTSGPLAGTLADLSGRLPWLAPEVDP